MLHAHTNQDHLQLVESAVLADDFLFYRMWERASMANTFRFRDDDILSYEEPAAFSKLASQLCKNGKRQAARVHEFRAIVPRNP